MEENLRAYNSIDVVEEYINKTSLQPPEETIFKQIEEALPNMKMLDIGIGAGRTTEYFAELTKEYIGVDYAEEMIIACKNRFTEQRENIKFEVCDVRSMKMFENNSFDFILFSFNGIDYINDQERSIAFSEIRRVGKSGGYFCFSTHNLNNTYLMFEFERFLLKSLKRFVRRSITRTLKFSKKHLIKNISISKLATAKKILSDPSAYYSNDMSLHKWLQLRLKYNKGIKRKTVRNSPFQILNDGECNFRLHTYYVKPIEQIKQLQNFCQEVHVYSLFSGVEVNENQLKEIKDPWLYFLCVLK